MTTPALPLGASYVSDVCWVGPLGQMKPLPDVKSSTAVPVERFGSIHRSLAGGLTVDTFARKRSWNWQWERMLEKQIVFLEALQYGTIPGPIRLIDPRRFNRIPEDVSTGGSVSRSNTAFNVDSGSFAYWHPLTDASTADPATLPAYGMLRGFMEWNIVAPGASNFLRMTDPRYADNRWRIPALSSEQLVTSVWILGPSSAQTALTMTWVDAANATVSTSTTGLQPMTLNAWSKLTLTATAPMGAVAVLLGLETSSPYVAANDSIFTTAWSTTSPSLSSIAPAYITEHCDIPEPTAGWRIGGGAPYVVADVGSNTYAELGFYGSGLTLYES